MGHPRAIDPSSGPASGEDASLVRWACLDLAAEQNIMGSVTSPVAGALLLWIASAHATPWRAWLWFGLLVVAAAVNAALATTYRWARRSGATGYDTLARAQVVVSAVFGVAWGLCAFLLDPGSAHRDIQVVVLAFVVGSAATNIVANAGSRAAFVCFQLPECLLPAVWALTYGDGFYLALALGLLLFLVISVGLHVQANDMVVSTITLQYRNSALADALAEQQAATQAANEELARLNQTLRSANARLSDQATRDPLTGIANRALFVEQLELCQARARREGGGLAVLYLDVDLFKTVNDSLGHGAGDVLLRSLSERIRSRLREVDVFARLGGDEFAVVAPGLRGPEDALVVARRVQAATEDRFTLDGHEVAVTVSVGVAYREPATSPARVDEDLLRVADAALYRAKQRGRNRIEVADPAEGSLLGGRTPTPLV